MAQKANASGRYDQFYYDGQVDGSLQSARIYARHLWECHQPRSVVDFGCGRGPWLAAFAELGADRLVGYDGPWNSQDAMIDPSIAFRGGDLNALVQQPAPERFDLAMSLEVVEHLKPERSGQAVDFLCGLADVVMFGAAFLHQPGDGHINTRLHSFWGQLFADRDFAAYDLFRPVMWGRADVPYWYQQNTFLYVRNGNALVERLAGRGVLPMARLALQDQVHPDLFGVYARYPARRLLVEATKAVLPRPVVNGIKRLRSRLR